MKVITHNQRVNLPTKATFLSSLHFCGQVTLVVIRMYINKNILILLVIISLVVFIAAFCLGQFILKIGTLLALAMAAVLSLGSDILIAVGNDRFNKSEHAKLHQRNELVGEYGKVIAAFKQQGEYYFGRIEVRSEKWNAKAFIDSLKEGDEVYIKDREGLVLIVENTCNQSFQPTAKNASG